MNVDGVKINGGRQKQYGMFCWWYQTDDKEIEASLNNYEWLQVKHCATWKAHSYNNSHQTMRWLDWLFVIPFTMVHPLITGKVEDNWKRGKTKRTKFMIMSYYLMSLEDDHVYDPYLPTLWLRRIRRLNLFLNFNIFQAFLSQMFSIITMSIKAN